MNKENAEKEFEIKYNLYGEMLYKIAFLYLANSHDAEDVLQDIFIKLLYSSPDFKDNEHEKAWLIRTIQNKCKDMLKSSSRKNIAIDDCVLLSSEENNDTRIDVITKIINLPVKYKASVILYYYYDYSVDDIAKILKITNSAVKMRLKRSREILKIELEDYDYEK